MTGPFIHHRHRRVSRVRRIGMAAAGLLLFLTVTVGVYLAVNAVTLRVAEAING